MPSLGGAHSFSLVTTRPVVAKLGRCDTPRRPPKREYSFQEALSRPREESSLLGLLIAKSSTALPLTAVLLGIAGRESNLVNRRGQNNRKRKGYKNTNSKGHFCSLKARTTTTTEVE